MFVVLDRMGRENDLLVMVSMLFQGTKVAICLNVGITSTFKIEREGGTNQGALIGPLSLHFGG